MRIIHLIYHNKVIYLLLISFLVFSNISQSQITLSPEKPGFTEEVTLRFNAVEGNQGLKDYEGQVYVHTGLITEQSSHAGDWKYVVADWNKNDERLKMVKISQNIWELKFSISSLYGVPPAGSVVALAFVFRASDGSKIGKAIGEQDIFYFLQEPKFKKAPNVSTISEAHEPDWSKSANIYEVNIRQYTKEGTFEAFSRHLPRLRDMGVNILWLMPIQPIGQQNRKGSLGSYYSIKDYKGINKEFGSELDFKKFVALAHDMGFKVILDWVANHTSWDNIWVSKHPEWYVRDDAGNPIAPYDWTDVIKLDYSNPDMRAAMIDALEYWIREMNLDGFRCDVAGEVPLDFWEEARANLDPIKSIWMLAEDADKHYLMNKAFNANYGWPLHHIMNEVAGDRAEAYRLIEQVEKDLSSYPKGSYPMHFITNHDENSWNGTEYERLNEGVKAFSVFYYMIPGMPLIYSGQEVANTKRLAFFEKDEIDWTNTDLISFYTKLNKLKSTQPVLWNGQNGGDFKPIYNDTADKVVSFTRSLKDDKILVVINLSSDAVKVEIDLEENGGSYEDQFSAEIREFSKSKEVLEMKPWEYKVYLHKKKM